MSCFTTSQEMSFRGLAPSYESVVEEEQQQQQQQQKCFFRF